MSATLLHPLLRPLRRATLSCLAASALTGALMAANFAPESVSSTGALQQQAAAQMYARQRQMAVDAPAVRPHTPWVWEVEGNGVRFWIAGCLHLSTYEDTTYFPAYFPFYDRADVMYFEVAPGAWERPEIADFIRRRGYVPSGRGVATRVSMETTRQLHLALHAQPDVYDQVRGMEPWLVSLTLAQEGYRRAGLTTRDSLESHLTARAISDLKPVGGLERPNEQIAAMAEATARDQERMLQGALINYQQRDFASGPLRRAWRSGDLAEMQKAVGVGPELAAEPTHFTMLTQRNMCWMEKMKKVAASGRTALYVVGVEHLVSSPGTLPELLRTEGFSVKRVSYPSDSPSLAPVLAKRSPAVAERR